LRSIIVNRNINGKDKETGINGSLTGATSYCRLILITYLQ
jgi:hypothetical protein